MDFNKSAFETLCVQEFFDHGKHEWAHNLPIYATSTFIYENREKVEEFFAGKGDQHYHIYSRWYNPTVMALEAKLAAMESFGLGFDAHAVCFGSGMGAISSALLGNLKAGDTLLAQGNLYGTTTEFIRKSIVDYGIKVIIEDLSDLNKVESILKKQKVAAMYLESPSNPDLACIDIQAIATLAKKHGSKTILDNTFNSPYVQQPLAFGIDYVVHSTTKFLSGHGNALGGVVIGKDKDDMHDKIWTKRKHLGNVLSPFDAWNTYNGSKTLVLRMDKHIVNAAAIADYLQDHQKVSSVNYLGLPDHPSYALAKKQMHTFGSMLSFELKDGKSAGKALIDHTRLMSLTASLGTTDTLITHPASTTHAMVEEEQRLKFGITDGLIRVAVGLEGTADLIEDLDQALKHV